MIRGSIPYRQGSWKRACGARPFGASWCCPRVLVSASYEWMNRKRDPIQGYLTFCTYVNMNHKNGKVKSPGLFLVEFLVGILQGFVR